MAFPALSAGTSILPGLPVRAGTGEERWQGTSGKTIFLIQDAHDSVTAQKNIARLIEHLVQHENVKTVYEEGYEGPVPTDEIFGMIKDPVVRAKTALRRLEALRIGGAEYAHINRFNAVLSRESSVVSKAKSKEVEIKAVNSEISDMPKAFNSRLTPQDPRQDFRLIGADSLRGHLENILDYRRAARVQSSILKDLDQIQSESNLMIAAQFPAPAREWLRLKERFDSGKLDLADYLRRSVSIYLNDHNRGLWPSAMREFVLFSPTLILPRKARGRKTAQSRYDLFLPPRLQTALLFSRYPKISDFILALDGKNAEAVRRVQAIQGSAFHSELLRFERELIFFMLGKSGVLHRVFRDYQALDLARKLARMELSPAEFQDAKKILKKFSTRRFAQFSARENKKTVVLSQRWEKKIKKALRFYESALRREEAVRKRLTDFTNGREGHAALVFGGFHAPRLKEIMRSLQISYVVISPRLGRVSKREHELYRHLMSADERLKKLPSALMGMSRVMSDFEWAVNFAADEQLRREILGGIENQTGKKTAKTKTAVIARDDSNDQKYKLVQRLKEPAANWPVGFLKGLRSEVRAGPQGDFFDKAIGFLERKKVFWVSMIASLGVGLGTFSLGLMHDPEWWGLTFVCGTWAFTHSLLYVIFKELRISQKSTQDILDWAGNILNNTLETSASSAQFRQFADLFRDENPEDVTEGQRDVMALRTGQWIKERDEFLLNNENRLPMVDENRHILEYLDQTQPAVDLIVPRLDPMLQQELLAHLQTRGQRLRWLLQSLENPTAEGDEDPLARSEIRAVHEEIKILRGGHFHEEQRREETLELLDENGYALPVSEEKTEPHANEEWRSVAHVYIFDPEGRLLLQKRSLKQGSSPGVLQISASGQVAAGETPEAAALRAGDAGLGLRLDPARLKKITIVKNRSAGGQDAAAENHEFVSVFAYQAAAAEIEEAGKNYDLRQSDTLWLVPGEEMVLRLSRTPEHFSGALRAVIQDRKELWQKLLQIGQADPEKIRAVPKSFITQKLQLVIDLGEYARLAEQDAAKEAALGEMVQFFKYDNPAIRESVYQMLRRVPQVEPLLLKLTENGDPGVASSVMLALSFMLKRENLRKEAASQSGQAREALSKKIEAILFPPAAETAPKTGRTPVEKSALQALGYLEHPGVAGLFVEKLQADLDRGMAPDSFIFEAAASADMLKRRKKILDWFVKNQKGLSWKEIQFGVSLFLDDHWISEHLSSDMGWKLTYRFGYMDVPLLLKLWKAREVLWGETPGPAEAAAVGPQQELEASQRLVAWTSVATEALVKRYLDEPEDQREALLGEWRARQSRWGRMLLPEEFDPIRPLWPVSPENTPEGKIDRDLFLGALRQADLSNADDKRQTTPFGYGYQEKHGGRFSYASHEHFQSVWDEKLKSNPVIFGRDTPEELGRILRPYFAADIMAVESETRKEPREEANARVLGRWRALARLVELRDGQLVLKPEIAKRVSLEAEMPDQRMAVSLQDQEAVADFISRLAAHRSVWKYALLDPAALEQASLFAGRASIQENATWGKLSYGTRSALKLYAYELLHNSSRGPEQIWPEWEREFHRLAEEERRFRGILPSQGIELQSLNIPASQVYLWKQALLAFDIPSPERLRYGSIVETAFRPAWTPSAFLLAIPVLHRMGLLGGSDYRRAAAFHISLSGDLGAEARAIAFPLSMFRMDRPENEALTDEKRAEELAWVLSKGFIHRNRVNQKADPDSDAPEDHTEIRAAELANRAEGSNELLKDYENFLPAVQSLGAALAAWQKSKKSQTQLSDLENKMAELWKAYWTELNAVTSEIPEAQALFEADWYESTGDSKDPKLVTELKIFKLMRQLRGYRKQNLETYALFKERIKSIFLEYARQVEQILAAPVNRSEVRHDESLSLEEQQKTLAKFLWKAAGAVPHQTLHWQEHIWDLAGALIDSGIFRNRDLNDEDVKQLAHFIWLAKSGPGRAIHQSESSQVSDWAHAHRFVHTTLRPWLDRISPDSPGKVGWAMDSLEGGRIPVKVQEKFTAMGFQAYQQFYQGTEAGGDYYRALLSENLRYGLFELADGAGHGKDAMQAAWFATAVRETESELGVSLLSILAENGGEVIHERVREYLELLQNKIDIATETYEGEKRFGFYTHALFFVDYQTGQVDEWVTGHHPAMVETGTEDFREWIQQDLEETGSGMGGVKASLFPLGYMLDGVSVEAVQNSFRQYSRARRAVLYTDGAWRPTKNGYGLWSILREPGLGAQETDLLFKTLQTKIINDEKYGNGVENDDVTVMFLDFMKGHKEYERSRAGHLNSNVRNPAALEVAAVRSEMRTAQSYDQRRDAGWPLLDVFSVEFKLPLPEKVWTWMKPWMDAQKIPEFQARFSKAGAHYFRMTLAKNEHDQNGFATLMFRLADGLRPDHSKVKVLQLGHRYVAPEYQRRGLMSLMTLFLLQAYPGAQILYERHERADDELFNRVIQSLQQRGFFADAPVRIDDEASLPGHQVFLNQAAIQTAAQAWLNAARSENRSQNIEVELAARLLEVLNQEWGSMGFNFLEKNVFGIEELFNQKNRRIPYGWGWVNASMFGRPGSQLSTLALVRVGDWFFVDHRLGPKMEAVLEIHPELRAAHFIYLYHLKSSLTDIGTALDKWAAPMVLAVDALNLKNQTVLDLGAGDAFLALMAAQKAAGQIFAVDYDSDARLRFLNHLDFNPVDGSRLQFIVQDLEDQPAVLARLAHQAPVDVIFANIGEHPGLYKPDTHLRAIEYLDFLPSVKVFVAGGYAPGQLAHGQEDAYQKAKAALEKRGFYEIARFTHRYTTQDPVEQFGPKAAIIFARRGLDPKTLLRFGIRSEVRSSPDKAEALITAEKTLKQEAFAFVGTHGVDRMLADFPDKPAEKFLEHLRLRYPASMMETLSETLQLIYAAAPDEAEDKIGDPAQRAVYRLLAQAARNLSGTPAVPLTPPVIVNSETAVLSSPLMLDRRTFVKFSALVLRTVASGKISGLQGAAAQQAAQLQASQILRSLRRIPILTEVLIQFQSVHIDPLVWHRSSRSLLPVYPSSARFFSNAEMLRMSAEKKKLLGHLLLDLYQELQAFIPEFFRQHAVEMNALWDVEAAHTERYQNLNNDQAPAKYVGVFVAGQYSERDQHVAYDIARTLMSPAADSGLDDWRKPFFEKMDAIARQAAGFKPFLLDLPEAMAQKMAATLPDLPDGWLNLIRQGKLARPFKAQPRIDKIRRQEQKRLEEQTNHLTVRAMEVERKLWSPEGFISVSAREREIYEAWVNAKTTGRLLETAWRFLTSFPDAAKENGYLPGAIIRSVEKLGPRSEIRAAPNSKKRKILRSRKAVTVSRAAAFRHVLLNYQDVVKMHERRGELAILAARHPEVQFRIYAAEVQDDGYLELRRFFKNIRNIRFTPVSGRSELRALGKIDRHAVLHLSTQTFDVKKRFGKRSKKIHFVAAGRMRGALAAALLYNPEHWLFRTRMSRQGSFWFLKPSLVQLGRQWLAGFVIASSA